jgi:spermidine/putrescine transport system permease protein
MKGTTAATGRPRWDRWLTLNGWFVFAFLYLPIFVVILFSFSGAQNVGIWGGFSLRWYERMTGNDQLLNALRNSLWVALWSTIIATTFGTAAALALDRYRKWVSRGAFDAILYLPVIIPDVTMAVMLLLWFTQIGSTSPSWQSWSEPDWRTWILPWRRRVQISTRAAGRCFVG